MKLLPVLPAVLAISAAVAQAQSGIVLTATSHNFVSVPEGASAKYGIHVTNNSTAPFPFQLSLTGSPNFTRQTDCPATLPVNAGCEVVFEYHAPTTSGWDDANFAIATNGVAFPNGSSGFLRAHSVTPGAITLNSQQHNFGQAPVGLPAAQKFGLNISNGAGRTVPFSYKTTGDTAAYSIETNCPAALPSGAQCSMVFAFKPTEVAWQTMQVHLETGDVPVAGGATVILKGNGTTKDARAGTRHSDSAS